MTFQLEEVRRVALWKPGTKTDFEQTGWGLSVRLARRDHDQVHGTLEMLVSDPAQIKMFRDAPFGAEFTLTIVPAT